jgi:prepilin-type N-terminal cleavage/methylation domain-containing protein
MMDLLPDHLRANRRRGVTLLELLVVVTLMGTLSTVVVTRYGRNIFGDMDARSEAHRLWIDLQHARSIAVRNGTTTSVLFAQASGKLTGYRIVEGPAGKQTVVGEPSVFGSDIRVTATSSTVQFTFEGHAASACQINVRGPNRSWVLHIVPLSGSVRISENQL